MLVQARSAFGIFVSDSIIATAQSSTDMLELAFATAAGIMLLWEYVSILHEWKDNSLRIDTKDCPHISWRVTEVVVDIVDLVQSVAVFLAVRLLTDLGRASVDTSVSSVVTGLTSVLLFVTLDSFLKARRRVPSALFGGTNSLAQKLASEDENLRLAALAFWMPFF